MPRHKRSMFRASLCWASVLMVAFSGCQMMNGHASNNLGSGYYREGNYQAARLSFQQAVVDMPENPDFRYNLAATMQKQGDTRGAEQVYRQALHIDPSHQPSYHALAQLMIAQGRPVEAESLVTSWVQTQPYTAAPHIEMAWLRQRQGNTSAAGESLQTALKLEPNHPIALAQLGQMYQANGQEELASAYYERSLQGNWRQPEVQNRLASLGPQGRGQRTFGGVPTRVAGAPTPIPLGWQPPRSQMAQLPMPNPAAFATAPTAEMSPQPTFAAQAPTFSPPQTQTAMMPPHSAGQFAMPIPMAGQPTPVTFPQTGEPTPVPTFAAGPPNADPAHVPQMTADLPIVQPY